MLDKAPPPFLKPFGLALGWAFFIFSILAVPLSVVTLMRWFALPWWLALLGVFFVSIIPYAGRFAYFGLSVIGAIYLVQAGFDLHEAVGVFIE